MRRPLLLLAAILASSIALAQSGPAAPAPAHPADPHAAAGRRAPDQHRLGYYQAVDLNAFQFAKELSQRSAGVGFNARAGKRLTEQECRDDFVAASGAARPPLRAPWCMRAYREFEGLYDVTLLALTQDRSREALLAQLTMTGVSHANAAGLGRRFLEAIEWQR